MGLRDWLARLTHRAAPAGDGRGTTDRDAVDRLTREGHGHQRAGAYGKARQCYRRILEAQPEHAEALFLLGEIALEEGNRDEAMALIERAIRSNGTIAAFHLKLGALREAAGDMAGATRHYEDAVALEPNHAEVHNNLGCLLEKQGFPDRAVAAYRKALQCDPELAQAHYNLGNVLGAQGRTDEAIVRYLSALAAEPGRAPVHYALGLALKKQGKLEAAIDSFQQALDLDPGFFDAARDLGVAWLELGDCDQAEAYTRRALQIDAHRVDLHLHLGNIFRQARKFEDALASFLDAVRLEPALAQAHNNLGSAYLDLGRVGDAADAFRKAIELDRGLAEAHLNLGIAVQKNGDQAAAIAHYLAALEVNPGLSEGWLNLGCLREHEGDPPGALDCYARAAEIKPDFAQAHFNHALQLLLAGRLLQGWEEYEWRWRLPDMGLGGVKAFRGRRHWEGEPLEGRTIFLFAEQGFGDAIQFIRYVPMVAARGGKVVVSCHAKLKALFGTVPGVTAISMFGEPPPDFDLCCSLLSLPRIFGTTLETIPAPVPYLRAAPERMRYWKDRLATRSGSLKVGLFWATDVPNTLSIAKSLVLDMLAPLAQVAGVSFYSLQRGAAAAQVASAPAGMNVVDLTPELADFSDDAALISNLDLVISIDTATAHLAGAMGAPVWTLTHFPPEWRWQLKREDSPWYPTMRLFRQQRGEAWPAVIERIAKALEQLAGSSPDCRPLSPP